MMEISQSFGPHSDSLLQKLAAQSSIAREVSFRTIHYCPRTVNSPEIHQHQPRMMPKNQCRCGVLFRSIQAIKRFKNRVVAAKRSIFGPGFPSFSSHHQFEAQAEAVINDQHDVDDDMWMDSSGMDGFFEDFSWIMPESFEEQHQQPPATLSSSPAVTLIQEEEPPDCCANPHNQTSSPSPGLIDDTSCDKWTLELSEVNNCNLLELNLPEILDEPVEGVMCTTTFAAATATTTTTTSFSTHNYGSETAPHVDSTTAYYGLSCSNYVNGSSVQNYDLMSQMLMRDGGFQGSQIITPPSPRRWCILKLIVWACKRLRFARLTLLSVRGASQSLVTTVCHQGLKRRWEDFEGIRCRKKESGKMWVAETRMTTKIYGPEGGKVWLGSFTTREGAARAHDVGRMFCSKASKPFNFPESQRILAPYKDTINQLPILERKSAIQEIAKQYGETGFINYLFGRQ